MHECTWSNLRVGGEKCRLISQFLQYECVYVRLYVDMYISKSITAVDKVGLSPKQCMYVLMYICMYIHTHDISIYTYIHTQGHRCIYTNKYTFKTSKVIHLTMYICRCIHTYAQSYIQ